MFDLEHLQSLPWIRDIDCHERLSSTNDRAALAADPKIVTPTLVLATEQTAGRGQQSNRWWSAPGALTFSLVLSIAEDGLSPEQAPRMSLTAGVAVCDALRRLAPDVAWRLKWPNDVVADGQKIGGILVEVPNLASPTERRIVLGIGLNVNNSLRTAPEELRQTGTSLMDRAERQYDLTDVLREVLAALCERIDELARGDARLPVAWQSLCALHGRTIAITTGGKQLVGVCEGIDREGAIVIQTETGAERCFSGSVVLKA